jgi:O-antigen ligase
MTAIPASGDTVRRLATHHLDPPEIVEALNTPTLGSAIEPARYLKMSPGVRAVLVLSVVGSLIAPTGSAAAVLGDASYFLLFGSLLVYALHYLIHQNNLRVMPSYLVWSFFCLNGIYATSMLWSADRTTSLKHIVSLASITFIVFVLTNLRWTRATLFRILLGASVFMIANLAFWAATGMSFRGSALFTHRNSLAAISYYFLFFPLAARSLYRGHRMIRGFCLVMAVIALVLLLAAGSRSVYLALVMSTITFILWPIITRSRLRHLIYFTTLLVGVVAFTIAYAYIQTWLVAAEALKAGVEGTTGGNLLSGRQTFWPEILALISERPVAGWGSGALPQNLLGQELSSHSLFLQWTLQLGLVGLALLFACFTSVWAALYRGRHLVLVRLSAAFLVGSMVRETFEVTLLQNKLVGIGSLAWVIFAIGLHAAMAEGGSSRTIATQTN